MVNIERPRIRSRSHRSWTRQQADHIPASARPWLPWLGAGALVVAGMVAVQRMAGRRRGEATAGDESRSDVEATPAGDRRFLQPPIDFVRAQEIALLANSSASVTSVELEVDGDALTWEVELDNGFEFEIDAMTGAVLEIDRDSEDWEDENRAEDEKSAEEDLAIRVDEIAAGGVGEEQDAGALP